MTSNRGMWLMFAGRKKTTAEDHISVYLEAKKKKNHKQMLLNVEPAL